MFLRDWPIPAGMHNCVIIPDQAPLSRVCMLLQ